MFLFGLYSFRAILTLLKVGADYGLISLLILEGNNDVDDVFLHFYWEVEIIPLFGRLVYPL